MRENRFLQQFKMDLFKSPLTVQNVSSSSNYREFDILPILTFLWENRRISLTSFLRMRKSFMSGGNCFEILSTLSVSDLKHALYMCYFPGVKDNVRCSFDDGFRMTTGNNSIHDSFHDFYILQKENLDEFAFKEPATHFVNLKKRFKKNIKSLPQGSPKQRCLLRKLMAVYCLRLQIYEDPAERFPIVKAMSNVLTKYSLPAAWDSIICGKLAYTHALLGDNEVADEHRQGTYFVLCTSNPCFIVYDTYYNWFLQKLAEFERTKEDSVKTRALFFGNTAMLLLQYEKDKVREHWARMFIPALCKVLLGVGIHFNAIDCEVTQADRDQARPLLAKMNQLSCGKRREMMYCFLMGKLLSEKNLNDAIAYAQRAVALLGEGSYREIERRNIAEFLDTLIRLRSETDKTTLGLQD